MTEVEASKYQPITFERRQVTAVVGGWPKFTQISLKFLCEPSTCKVTPSGMIEIRANNGWAIYRLTVEQVSEHYLCLQLEDSGT